MGHVLQRCEPDFCARRRMCNLTILKIDYACPAIPRVSVRTTIELSPMHFIWAMSTMSRSRRVPRTLPAGPHGPTNAWTVAPNSASSNGFSMN